MTIPTDTSGGQTGKKVDGSLVTHSMTYSRVVTLILTYIVDTTQVHS